MLSKARRAAIRKWYRAARIEAGVTQLDVETRARLRSGRYWKFENAVSFPDTEERAAIARILKVDVSVIPSPENQAESEAVAS